MQETCRGTRHGVSDAMEPEFCTPIPTAPSPPHCLPAPTAHQHHTAPSCFLILPATEVGPTIVTDIIPVKGLMHTFKHTNVPPLDRSPNVGGETGEWRRWLLSFLVNLKGSGFCERACVLRWVDVLPEGRAIQYNSGLDLLSCSKPSGCSA